VTDTFIRNYVESYRPYKNGRWCYEDGCFYKGMADIYQSTGDRWFLDQLVRHVNSMVQPDGSINGYNLEEYTLDNINAGKVLFLLRDETGDGRYEAALKQLRVQFDGHPRTNGNNFWHKKGYPWQVWLDGMYMGPPVLARYSLDYEDGKALADIRSQFETVRRLMFDPGKTLYYHGYDESRQAHWADKTTGLSTCFWSRGIAWFVMALVDMCDLLPANHTDRILYADLLNEIADGILAWQQKSGLWMQVIDQPEREGNYAESSASAMFAYGFLKGNRLDVLPARYAISGRKAYDAIIDTFIEPAPEGFRMGGICLMAGLGDLNGEFGFRNGKFDYYVSEPVVENDPKGVGPFMMTKAEMQRQVVVS
jgi:unsaturated rhamnogalacturonyl hydrolase